ncbi:hypothetical protein L6E12_10160 [Actinokineospora sp. PR83]|uniref:hypothetical protein n=1 Tax=Actinokineospora sp. PR83 TaxID=2884908 RepID=UPI001F3C0DB5|nr:hypothetical protein [Actinokineospora sp. PR83]MCG8916153.1 hypothetical protein [Actinokineospora sp. PR83]
MRNRIASAAAAGVIAVITAVGAAPTASATDPSKAPAGYAGPFSSCSGQLLHHIPLAGTTGYVNVWYSSAGSGTFCAMTFDNLAGSHHTEVILRHEDWDTPWYDSGDYTTYAGGIYVSGMNTRCAWVWGRVVVNGVDHNTGWVYIC